MRNWKRFFAIFLALVLVTGLLPPVDATAVTTPKPTGSGVHQPYAEITLLPSDSAGTQNVDTSQYVSQEEAALQIRQQMISRQEIISVKIYSSNADHRSVVNDLLEAVFTHTGEPKEGDSLYRQYGGYRSSVAMQGIAGVYYYSMDFDFEYFTTAQQEAQLDAKVAEVLASMDLEGKTDYQKVKAIYDWLCANVTYDYENLNNQGYLLKHSAYAAMIHKTAVCQGYALAFYRMALELGIDARYISGIGGSGRHGWNIVELEELYYNLDSTWDAGSASYSYFLTSDANFYDHTRDEEFTTAAFYAAYPMGTTNYVPAVPPDLGDQTGSAGENIQWALDENGVLTISGSGPMDDYQSTSETPWAHIREYIREVVVKEGVTTVGEYALGGCANLAKVTLPEGLASIGWMAFLDCISLRSINIPSSVSYIGAYAFRDCAGLPAITISAGVTYLGWGAFAGCYGLTQIQVEQANGAFADVDGVLYTKDGKMLHSYPAGRTDTAFSVPAGVETLNYHAFDSAVYLQQVTLPKGLLTIEGVAFQNCQALTDVTLPGSITFIGNSAFYYCQNLATIYYLGTQEMWAAVDKQADWDENTGDYTLHVQEAVEHCHTTKVITAPTAESEGSLHLTCAVPDCEHNGYVTLPALNMVDYTFTVVAAPADGNPGTGRFTWRVTDYGEFSFDVTFRYGDVDGNGADVNGDGQINGQDVVLLRRYMANYDYDTGKSTIVLGPQD